MEEEKREEEAHHLNNSSSTPTMTFSDEISSTSMSMNSTNNLSFPFQPLAMSTTLFDLMPSSSFCDQKASSSFGFMDLLSVHDYNPSLFDWLPTVTVTATPVSHPLPSPASSNVPDSSEVLNTPASPNSSSISSSSNEATGNNRNEQQSSKAANEHEAEDEGGDGDGDGDGGKGDDQDQDKTKKQ